jgi:hypothetical protein
LVNRSQGLVAAAVRRWRERISEIMAASREAEKEATVRSIARECVVMLLVAGMVSLPAAAGVPAMGANEKPLGMVVLATNAQVDSAEASMGANVYGGDALETGAGGTLRMKVGTGQLYLLGDSAATLVETENTATSENGASTPNHMIRAHAKLTRGTMGFSASSADGVAIETPVGTVRPADNQARAFGQVMLRSEREMIVSSYTGTLVVERDGEEHVIPEGKTYDVNVEANGEANAEPQKYGVTSARKSHLTLTLIVVGAAAVGGFFLWCAESVSDYHPPCH